MANNNRMDCVILGLLAHEPLTGYDIKKRIDHSLSFFWNGSYGSIYPTLAKLTEDNLVQAEAGIKKGRDKITYHITEAGECVLVAWLREPVKKDELKLETLLKLFFGNEIGALESLEHIERFEQNAKERLQILRMFEKNLSQALENETHKYYLLTVLMGIEVYQGFLKWCQKAREILEAGKS